MIMNPALLTAAMIAVRDCMGVKTNEEVLIITDEPLRNIGYAIWAAVKELGNPVLLVEILPRKSNGEEPPHAVGKLMKMMDVVLCPTSTSLTHTDSRRAASAMGVRIATMPGVSEDIMVRCMNADYNQIAERTFRLCAILGKTNVVRVKAPSGTDVTLPIKGRKAHASSGLFREKGQWGNLPTGEAYLAPLEGVSQGVVVVDGSMAGVGVVNEPIRITIEDGYATDISGGAEAHRLCELLKPYSKEARTVAEFGIGTNDKAILMGNILEDEKAMGTIHIAFGDNKSMGGSVRVASHLDGLIKKPTVWFDDKKIMESGNFIIDL